MEALKIRGLTGAETAAVCAAFCALVIALVIVITHLWLNTISQAAQALDFQPADSLDEEPVPELTHGERNMAHILHQRAQRLYDAANTGGTGTVMTLTHPKERSSCTPNELAQSLLSSQFGMPELPTLQGLTNAPQIRNARIWHGHRLGVTRVHNKDGTWAEIVWERASNGSPWLAFPGCAAGQTNQAPNAGPGRERRSPASSPALP